MTLIYDDEGKPHYYYTVSDLADVLEYTRETVLQMRLTGRLPGPSQFVGGRLWYTQEDVDRIKADFLPVIAARQRAKAAAEAKRLKKAEAAKTKKPNTKKAK